MGALVAAISHDVDHPGFNNSFLVSTKDEIALLYNDQSVLENHHVAQTFLLLRQDELNIFKHFTPKNYTRVREIMIKMVLATDMFYHGSNMQQMQRIIEKTRVD
jgi:high affinity cGMP-specific 3',5'-cyclic phosphodiesterase 9